MGRVGDCPIDTLIIVIEPRPSRPGRGGWKARTDKDCWTLAQAISHRINSLEEGRTNGED